MRNYLHLAMRGINHLFALQILSFIRLIYIMPVTKVEKKILHVTSRLVISSGKQNGAKRARLHQAREKAVALSNFYVRLKCINC